MAMSMTASATTLQKSAPKELTYEQLQLYMPASQEEEGTLTIEQSTRKLDMKLTYDAMVDGWYGQDETIPFGVGYQLRKDELLVGAPSSDQIYVSFDIPVRQGQVTTYDAGNQTMTKHSKIRTLNGRYGKTDNCLVVENMESNTVYYFAQGSGLIAIVEK